MAYATDEWSTVSSYWSQRPVATGTVTYEENRYGRTMSVTLRLYDPSPLRRRLALWWLRLGHWLFAR